ncbi:MAG: NCS2 family permease [Leptolyngbyaceae cyanobacterium MO_188.B28]|nr:NCS2 family permease [Leptolyngbyaceae cyanobacterium MO_188.B28]
MSGNVDELERSGQEPVSDSPNQFLYVGWQAAIANYFKFSQFNTDFRTEILAGVTTFMTMAYILVVNPLILSDGIFINAPGDLFPQLVVATAVSAALGTLIMALYANYPFCLAPGMGINAFFTYSVVLGLGVEWRLALAAVFIEGLIFVGLTLTDIRRQIIKAIPMCLKSSTGAGIGLFIAYIGLAGDPATGGAGIIVANEVTKTAFGSLTQPPTLMAITGLFLTAAFLVRRVKGGLLWGILATAVLGWMMGVTPWPQGIVQAPPAPSDIFGQAILGVRQISGADFLNFAAVLFVFLFVDMFDTIGTLAGVGMKAGYIDQNGELPRANKALMADAIATTTGAVMGTSSVTTYVESASGVAEGGRTGFTGLVVSGLFLVSILFIPILSAIPAYATAPTLVIVGVLMMSNVAAIRWGDLGEAIPAFLTIFMIPLTFSIAEGLAIGFITYPLVKACQGKAHEVPIPTWILAGVFVARFVFMTLRFSG